MARQMTSSQFHKSKSLDNKYVLGDEVGKGAYHHLKRNRGGVNKFLSLTPNKILLKVDKSNEDKAGESKRNELLKF